MGYTTDFEGHFTFDRPVDPALKEYLSAFSNIRHVKRDVEKLKSFKDIRRENIGLPLGKQGEYYVGSVDDGNMGQMGDDSVLSNNDQPDTQPGLWCQWRIADNSEWLIWDDGEKFYNYTEWLTYLVEHFFKRFGYVLNGEVTWQGEDSEDYGIIGIEDNKVYYRQGRRSYGEKEYVE
jgi:hypothetical protein